ncbi:AAA family ATPase [Sphingomonas sp. 3-13AW]|uniref:AAA family ATPase n=1 Tax=Sphingomonas sp. 3-13AW TaxID=3050450 RepID=UPI003BB52842
MTNPSSPSPSDGEDIAYDEQLSATADARVSLDPDETMERIFEQSKLVLDAIRNESMGETGGRAEPTYPISRAAELVGRSDSMIREAEKSGRLPEPKRTENGRRVNYTLSAINHMRQVFGTAPRRAPDEKTAILAVQNFKGGVGKSTIAVNLAQYLAIKGYRVCLIDCDSQATSTSMFGYRPDLDLDGEADTLYGYLRYPEEGVTERMIKDTHFDGLKLIPANLDLYNAEYELAAIVAKGREEGGLAFNRLSAGIQSISDRFDIVVLDPPPALGMVSLGVLAAANAMVIPVPPTIVDFSSTASFVGMAQESMRILSQFRAKPIFNFVRLVASKTTENKGMHKTVLRIMQRVFGRSMINATLKESAEIDNASARFKTVYELDKPISKRDVHDRCLASLNAVCGEIELEIRKTWPSHHEALLQENLM